jgi:hypothetical protein
MLRRLEWRRARVTEALDRAALNAFHEWRFETGTVRQFRVPIKYEMRESGPRVMVGMDQAPGATDADVAKATATRFGR